MRPHRRASTGISFSVRPPKCRSTRSIIRSTGEAGWTGGPGAGRYGSAPDRPPVLGAGAQVPVEHRGDLDALGDGQQESTGELPAGDAGRVPLPGARLAAAGEDDLVRRRADARPPGRPAGERDARPRRRRHLDRREGHPPPRDLWRASPRCTPRR